MLLRSFFASITSLSIRFKWVTIGLTILFLVLGVIGALQLNQELLPDIEFPQIFVVTFRPGATSEDLLNLVTIPLEKALAEIEGVIPEGLESTTAAPVAFIIVSSDFGINQNRLREQISHAIDAVIAEGVPVGLETTADLTPEIMRKVLSQAPSMWQHFKSEHLLAMAPEVLDAALAVNPEFADQLDFLARDQIAAERVSSAVTGISAPREPVKLPRAWLLSAEDKPDSGLPRLLTFDLSAIPVVSASISSADPNLTPDQLREFVEANVLGVVGAVEGVANVRVSGGQQIPQDVYEAAVKAVALEREAATNPEAGKTGGRGGGGGPGNSSPEPPPTNPPAKQPENTIPALPNAWRTIRVGPIQLPNPLPTQLRERFGTTAAFDTADDLLRARDGSGEALTAAALLNQVVQVNDGLLRDFTPPEVLAYLRGKEPGFTEALSEAALGAFAAGVLRSGPWVQLLSQEGFEQANLNTALDLGKINGNGSVAAALNAIVRHTPAEFVTFAIRLVDTITPEFVAYVQRAEPGFLTVLDAQVLRYMSAETLKFASDFVSGLADEALRAELQAIADGTGQSAARALEGAGGGADMLADDPNAPPMPASWTQALASFGLDLRTAQDLLRKPFGLSAAEFLNQSAANPRATGLMAELTPEILLYLGEKDPTFFDGLNTSTLSLLAPETLARLPQPVQDRAQGNTAFTPVARVTRTDGRSNLLLTVNKESDANTVAVFHAVEKAFQRIEEENPGIQISTIFEQASFIEESISGVAREGGLGAIMAVVVILLFLNFSVRSTLVTAVSIPASVAMAFMLMRWMPGAINAVLVQPDVEAALPPSLYNFLTGLFPAGITLNIMTLSGLTVAIGRVVDDSIVVLENIYRQLQKGMDRREAVIKGTRDVSLAIFAATLTTIVVFLPIGLTGGIVGVFFLPFGMAVTYALGSSFLVAITIVPLLAYLFIRPESLPEEKTGPLEKVYHGLLGWALNHRLAVMIIATITLFVGLAIFATRPTTFLPALGEPQITVTVSMPSGTPLAQTDVRVRELEAYLETRQAEGGITRYQTTVGSGGAFSDIGAFLGGGGNVDGAAAQIVAAVHARGDELAALTLELRDKAGQIFGPQNVTVSRASFSEQGFGGFEIVVSGPEEALLRYNDKIIETLSGLEGLTNVTSSLELVGDTASYLRVNQAAAVQYSAELEIADTLGVTRRALEAVRQIEGLPPTITVGQGFQSQVQTEGFAQTFSAMGIAVVAVYLVMVFTFGSLVHPFTILFSLPLAVVGAAVGLWLTDRVVGISALVGLLMLVGIVVTNAIVMIDRVQQNRRERHMPAREALVEGARTRLRPILMTAIATMFALLPLAVGLSQGAIIAAELGTVVIGGLFSSTALTLLVVPVVYSLFEGLQRRVMGRKQPQGTGD